MSPRRSRPPNAAPSSRQLLAFARKTRLEPRAIDLSHLVTEFSEVIESSVSKYVDLHLSLRRGLPHVVVDPDQLEMALLNIVNNARDAMPNGGEVTIGTRRLSLTPETARELAPATMSCSRGEGRRHGHAARGAGARGRTVLHHQGRRSGHGLGLAMASGFLRQSGGRLDIESEDGRGTSVMMIFPVARPSKRRARPMPASTR